jgi:DNA-binding NarL/FixJ family response regulator
LNADSRPTESGVELPELFTSARWNELAKYFGLTERQRQVARLICCGCTNAGIAGQLRVSEGTVRLHADALFKALEVRSRIGVVVRLVLVDRTLRNVKKRMQDT